ncbi:MAG: Uncharacterized protein G01um101430_754 [Parcubacteria group bacterium Gr01-1014_30]|nr:MAG: Uncharacterized protein G01um101430_754 [Parcubacteria group bacterium Gr01-1014_30]
MLHLKENEKVLLITRRHWLVLVFHILPTALAFSAIVIAILLLPFVSLGPLSDWLAETFPIAEYSAKITVAFLLALLLLILWEVIFMQVAHYYLDTWVVTDQRTVHTELLGLFNRFLTSIYHHQIQDVSVDVKGILPTFMNYGNVQIQTAGAHREFVFREIPEPYKTKELIVQAQFTFLRELQESGSSPENVEKEQKPEELARDD